MSIFGEDGLPFIAGLAIGALLLLCGALVGYLVGRRRRGDDDGEQIDRGRMLSLLRDLGKWTREYRGGVAEYQERLDEISSAARVQDGNVQAAGVLPLVERLMQSNRQLQTRLDAAEQQLEHQTRQIESCLTEARTDALTGLPNRRAFDQKTDELYAAFQRTGEAFVLALIDIDHFKGINDTYGHQAGDVVLRQVATRMNAAIQDCLMVARYGGEEFAVLLPAPLAAAAVAVDAFRKACAAKPIACEGQPLTVTVSAGLGEITGDAGIAPLVRRADEALYAAKGRGRNRTYFHDGDAPVLVGAPEVAGRS